MLEDQNQDRFDIFENMVSTDKHVDYEISKEVRDKRQKKADAAKQILGDTVDEAIEQTGFKSVLD